MQCRTNLPQREIGTHGLMLGTCLAMLGSFSYGASVMAAEADDYKLEEIIVTAQRRSEDLQQTPVAVTVFSANDLTQRNVRNISDLVVSTPNLAVASLTPSSGTGSAVFFLRGLGQQRGGNGTQPAVGIYIDDFYYPALSGSLLRVMDIGQLEVLRGPQGTLFGRNTIGGAIRYTSAAPSQEFGGHAELTAGDYNRRDVSGTINVPVSSSFALRLGAASLAQDGYVINQLTGDSVGDTRNSVVRVQARFKPNEQWTVDVTGERVMDDLRGYGYVVTSVYTGTGATVARWNANPTIAGQPLRDPTLPSYGQQYVSSCEYCQVGDTNEFNHNQITDYRATIAWSPSERVTVKSLTGWFDVRSRAAGGLDRSPLPIVQSTSSGKTTSLSQEFQFTGSAFADDRLHWTAGLYAIDTKFLDDRTSVSFGTAALPTKTDYENKAEAAYGQVSFAITPEFIVTGGGRYSQEKYVTKPTIALSGPPRQASFSATADDSNFSPMLKAQYQWTPELMTYVSATKGFRGGGINQASVDLPSNGLVAFEPETMTSYEAGIRSKFLDDRLQLNATYFDAKYDKIQTTRPVIIPGPPGIVTVIENAGKGGIRGAELEARGVIQRLQLHATLATIDTFYDSIGNSQSITTSSEFAHAPKLSYSFGGSYTQPLPSGEVRLSADWGWQDTQKSTPNQVQSSQLPPGSPAEAQDLPSYGLLSARATYVFEDKLWTVALAGTNLLNKYYYTGGANFATIAPNYYEPGAPRQVTLSVQRKF